MDKAIIERVAATVKALEPELKELTMNIHDNPELGNQEFKAYAWQLELLRKYGFEIEEHFCGIPTAYKATYLGKKPGPRIAMLAEYDALPKLGHGCGHNLICMMSVGSGIAMREYADEFGGEIYVIGTPAEETEGAKVHMSKAGAFDDMDVCMMAHPGSEDASSWNTMAMVCRSYEFFGKTAHAAAAPEEGLNALDAVINMFNMVNALRQQTKDGVRIHGIISHGGEAPNIIPDYTRTLFYIRAPKWAELEDLERRVEFCAQGAALATDTAYKSNPEEVDFMDTNSNMHLNRLACDVMEELGVPMKWMGAETSMGSSDLGDVSYRCPSIQLVSSLGRYPDGRNYVAHTSEFCELAATDWAINHSFEYIKGFVLTAIKLMTEPEHLAEIKREFANMR
ncbi:MAG: amidohydrolase [Firmicutes bacterium]|nr:amidohydrolase [Bacillota bacterium]